MVILPQWGVSPLPADRREIQMARLMDGQPVQQGLQRVGTITDAGNMPGSAREGIRRYVHARFCGKHRSATTKRNDRTRKLAGPVKGEEHIPRLPERLGKEGFGSVGLFLERFDEESGTGNTAEGSWGEPSLI